MLKYALSANNLSDGSDTYIARTHPVRSYNLDEVVELLMQRGTTLTRADIVAVLTGLEEVVTEIVRDGATVNLPLFRTSFSIAGLFDSPTDTFDPHRHTLRVNVVKGQSIRRAEQGVALEKTTPHRSGLLILEVTDLTTNAVNRQLTPGGIVQLRGHYLKIAGDNADNGLWFTDSAGNTLRSPQLIVNTPKQLLAIVPPLAPGDCTLSIVTQYRHSCLRKTVYAQLFDKELRVD